MPPPVLEIRNLSVHFETGAGNVQALRNVSLSIGPEETVGLAGESGSGKSTLAYSIMRYLPPNGRITQGEILFNGEDLLGKNRDELREIWGNRLAMVYQDPKSSLNPSMRIGQQIAEVIQIHCPVSSAEAWQRALTLLDLVNIPDPPFVARKYPHQLSGGMQQRVIIAMALACGPNLLIMDEPTTGLDVTTQARILELIEGLKERVKAAILYITHDLSVIAQVSDRVAILYAGEMVEAGPVDGVFHRPAHPYTIGLLGALPQIDLVKAFKPIRGRLPDLTRLPGGCIFTPRCDFAEEACSLQVPDLVPVEEGHRAKCFRWQEVVKAQAMAPEPPPVPRVQRPPGGIFEVERLKKYYGEANPLARRLGLAAAPVRAVDDVSFDIRRNEFFALVGESGCGKTTLGRLIVKLLRPTAGRVRYYRKVAGSGEVLSAVEFRKSVQIIFQHPDSSLNPMKTIRAILERPLKLQGMSKEARRRRVIELLESVKLDAGYLDRYPRELSGGEKQRGAIARAFAPNPQFVVLDEPVSALDVSVQASIMTLLMDLKAAMDASYLFISHDLSLVRHVADRVGVMYLGRLCEVGSVEEIFNPPYHPYTQALLSSIPVPDPSVSPSAIRLEGSVPSAQSPPPGCRFHTRCPRKVGRICEEVDPPFSRAGESHWIACHIPLETLWQDPPVRFSTGTAG